LKDQPFLAGGLGCPSDEQQKRGRKKILK